MTSKQRILSALKGEEIDHVPWSPFLAYYWEHQSKEVQEGGQVKFLEGIGADPLIRGAEDILPVTIKYEKSNVYEVKNKGEIRKFYETPVGTITELYIEAPGTWFQKEHSIKTTDDLRVLKYLHDDMYFTDNFEELNRKIREYGERALMVPIIGVNRKTAFQSLLEQWFGTEALVYAVFDYRDQIDECLKSMRKASVEYLKIAVESEGEAFISWEDTSTTNINPAWFLDFIAPEINDWCDIIHGKDKLYFHHACGHLDALVDLIAETEIDALESISPPPTGNIAIQKAREVLPERIAIIGGIEPVIFERESLDFVLDYTRKLLDDMKGSRYILANSDSCPPGVSLEKFKSISGMVKGDIH